METVLVGPPVEYTDTQPIQTKKTHPWLSHYVIQTVEFVNRFSTVCEQKLSEMSRQLERLEITMSFLEAKLNSIPGLEGVAPLQSTSSQEPILPTVGGGVPGGGDDILAGNVPAFSLGDDVSVMNIPAGSAPVDAGPLVKEHPKFAHFFKMQRLGVPEPQIANKIRSEGVDPSILQNPDAPASQFLTGGGRGKGSDDDDIFDDGSDDEFDD